MLEKDCKQFEKLLPEYYSDEQKEIIIRDLYTLAELILDCEDYMKILNKTSL